MGRSASQLELGKLIFLLLSILFSTCRCTGQNKHVEDAPSTETKKISQAASPPPADSAGGASVVSGVLGGIMNLPILPHQKSAKKPLKVKKKKNRSLKKINGKNGISTPKKKKKKISEGNLPPEQKGGLGLPASIPNLLSIPLPIAKKNKKKQKKKKGKAKVKSVGDLRSDDTNNATIAAHPAKDSAMGIPLPALIPIPPPGRKKRSILSSADELFDRAVHRGKRSIHLIEHWLNLRPAHVRFAKSLKRGILTFAPEQPLLRGLLRGRRSIALWSIAKRSLTEKRRIARKLQLKERHKRQAACPTCMGQAPAVRSPGEAAALKKLSDVQLAADAMTMLEKGLGIDPERLVEDTHEKEDKLRKEIARLNDAVRSDITHLNGAEKRSNIMNFESFNDIDKSKRTLKDDNDKLKELSNELKELRDIELATTTVEVAKYVAIEREKLNVGKASAAARGVLPTKKSTAKPNDRKVKKGNGKNKAQVIFPGATYTTPPLVINRKLVNQKKKTPLPIPKPSSIENAKKKSIETSANAQTRDDINPNAYTIPSVTTFNPMSGEADNPKPMTSNTQVPEFQLEPKTQPFIPQASPKYDENYHVQEQSAQTRGYAPAPISGTSMLPQTLTEQNILRNQFGQQQGQLRQFTPNPVQLPRIPNQAAEPVNDVDVPKKMIPEVSKNSLDQDAWIVDNSNANSPQQQQQVEFQKPNSALDALKAQRANQQQGITPQMTQALSAMHGADKKLMHAPEMKEAQPSVSIQSGGSTNCVYQPNGECPRGCATCTGTARGKVPKPKSAKALYAERRVMMADKKVAAVKKASDAVTAIGNAVGFDAPSVVNLVDNVKQKALLDMSTAEGVIKRDIEMMVSRKRDGIPSPEEIEALKRKLHVDQTSYKEASDRLEKVNKMEMVVTGIEAAKFYSQQKAIEDDEQARRAMSAVQKRDVVVDEEEDEEF